VVANVPFGVAFLGSVTSTVGHTLTGLFESYRAGQAL
jgi:conjugal transfer mating pair stabilization protein TraG